MRNILFSLFSSKESLCLTKGLSKQIYIDSPRFTIKLSVPVALRNSPKPVILYVLLSNGGGVRSILLDYQSDPGTVMQDDAMVVAEGFIILIKKLMDFRSTSVSLLNMTIEFHDCPRR